VKVDAIVIGSGVAGVSAALTLKRRGKNVLVLTKNGGATSVSSGAWDFGPIQGDASFEAMYETPAWQALYRSVLVDASELANPSDVVASCEALAKDLKVSFNFKRPYLLPTSSGKWKRTYGAQSLQVKADLNALKNKKVGLVASDRWRFRADLIRKNWMSLAELQGTRLDLEIVPVEAPSSQGDWPLPHIAARFQNDSAYRTAFIESLRKKVTDANYDTLLFPPIFLEHDTAEQVQKELGVNIAECLAGAEPVAGHRLQKNLERLLQKLEIPVIAISQLQAETHEGAVRKLRGLTKQDPNWQEWEAPFIVLASGKFFGGGIELGYQKVRETIFELPCYLDRMQGTKQYRSELDWRDTRFADEQPWAKLGLWLDQQWRPRGTNQQPVLKNVTAAGSIIGGVDFARESVGLGFFAYSGRQCAHVLA